MYVPLYSRDRMKNTKVTFRIENKMKNSIEFQNVSDKLIRAKRREAFYKRLSLSTDWIIVLQWRTLRELSLQWEIICKTCVYTNTTKYILIHICIIKELTKYNNFMHKKLLFSLRHIITDIPVNYHFLSVYRSACHSEPNVCEPVYERISNITYHM